MAAESNRMSCEAAFQTMMEESRMMPLIRISANFLRRRSGCSVGEAIKLVQRGSLEIANHELQFGDKLGEGATGMVFKASWKGKMCAAKMLKHGIQQDTSEYRDLISELKILASVGSHRNLVSFYGASIEDLKAPVIVEEYMEGPDLETFLSSKHPGFNLGRITVHRWSVDILSALNHLHDRDPIIMHRDLKPSNILLSRDRKVLKLADFGLAKEVARHERMLIAHAGNAGTLRYMAPEVMQQLSVDEEDVESQNAAAYTEKADIYSASLVMWYILTGLQPYLDIRQNPLARPPAIRSQKRWEELSALLERMWHAQPELRPSAGQCLRQLDDLEPSFGRGCFSMFG